MIHIIAQQGERAPIVTVQCNISHVHERELAEGERKGMEVLATG